MVCLQWLQGCFQFPYLRKTKWCRTRNGNYPFPNIGSNIKAIFSKNHKMLQASNEMPSRRLGGNLWCKQTWKCMKKKKNLDKGSLFFYPSLNSGLGHRVLFMAVMSANTELSFNLFWKIQNKRHIQTSCIGLRQLCVHYFRTDTAG